mmetsp:Transcript_35843/g.89290  ORF Transcript_35843/g.89290 Transcript_35843/m.89290 type:complete len:206 (+) Transcript_35843:568-1185(+)
MSSRSLSATTAPLAAPLEALSPPTLARAVRAPPSLRDGLPDRPSSLATLAPNAATGGVRQPASSPSIPPSPLSVAPPTRELTGAVSVAHRVSSGVSTSDGELLAAAAAAATAATATAGASDAPTDVSPVADSLGGVATAPGRNGGGRAMTSLCSWCWASASPAARRELSHSVGSSDGDALAIPDPRLGSRCMWWMTVLSLELCRE